MTHEVRAWSCLRTEADELLTALETGLVRVEGQAADAEELEKTLSTLLGLKRAGGLS